MGDEIKRNRIYRILIPMTISILIVSFVLFQFVLAEEMSVDNNCEDEKLVDLRTMLANIPSSNSQGRILIEEKIDMFEKMAAICETITPATINPNHTIDFIPWTPPPFETGIFEGQTGDFHAFEAKIENHWRGVINGDRVFVFAGTWVNDASQGFIAVKTLSGRSQTDWGYYPSPTKSGTLRIIDVKNSRLIIKQANDEKILYFDVPALLFVDSLDETVVPITPTESHELMQTAAPPYPTP